MSRRADRVRTHRLVRSEITRTGGDIAGRGAHSRDLAALEGAPTVMGGMPPFTDRSTGHASAGSAAGTTGRRPARLRGALVALAVCLATVACGGRAPETLTQVSQVGAAAADEPTGVVASPDEASTTADADATTDQPRPAGRSGPRTAAPQQGADGQPEPAAEPTAPPTVPDFPTDVVKVAATVEPACVKPGGTATITVTTRPDAGVGYHAFYADGKGGGPPPYGNSYGGNDGGLADEDGRYTGSWTVAPSAPSGSGRVDVVVGHDGEFGSTSAAFSVADALTGTCAQ